MVNYEKRLEQLRNLHKGYMGIGSRPQDHYTRGVYNGLELALSLLENREPVYKEVEEVMM